MSGRHAGNCDPAGLHRQDLVDFTISEPAVKLLTDPIQKFYIQLVVQEVVHLHDLCSDGNSFRKYFFFQFFHLISRP